MPYELKEDKLSRKLLNIFQIPLLLSLGLHVLVYIYGFPTLVVREEVKKISDRVRTIELNPAIQRRLPNLEANTDVPYFNSSPIEGSLLEEPAAPFALPLPPNFNPSDLPSIPLPPGYQISELPRIGYNIELPPLGITDLSALPLPPPTIDLDSLDAPPTEPPGDLPPPEEQPPKPEQPIAPPPETETNKQEETKPTPEQIAAVRDQKLDKNIRDLSSSLKQSQGATTDAEAQRNYVDWLSKIEQAQPKPLTLVGTYPRDACIRRLKGTSVYGVIVDGNNAVVALELLKGAKYPLFNEQAAQDIQKNNFQNTSQAATSYAVTVNYEYNSDICPSLTLPSIRRKEEAENQAKPKPEETKPTLETQPKPTPEETKPKPEAKPEPEPTPEETKPTPEAKPEPEPTPEETKPKPEAKPLPSLRERLRNTPLPDDDTIRERLRRNPLPPK